MVAIEKYFMLIRNYLHKSRSQTVSMFLIIFMATALMSIGALTLIDYGNFFDLKAAQLNAPHLIAIIDKMSYSPAHLDYLRSDSSVTNIEVEDVLFLDNCSFWYGNGKNTQSIIIQNAATCRNMSPLTIIDEIELAAPNALYAPYMLHAGGGYEVGDTFIVEYENQEYEFLIAGFIEDIMLGATNMGVFGFYMPEPLFVKYLAESSAKPAVLLSAQLNDQNLSEEVSNGFMKFCSESKSSIWGFSIIILKMARTMITNMVSMIIVAFALIIVMAALIIIYFRINDSIHDDIKDIGILKSMGYTNRQIKLSILLQFLSISILAGILGIFISYLAIPFVSKMFSAQSGLIWEQGFAPLTSALCLFTLLLAVIMNVFFSLRKMKNLHPIMAIREETKASGVKRNYFALDRIKGGLHFLMAGKLVMENLWQNIIIALIIATITFASAFGLVMYYNMAIDPKSFIDTVGGEMCSVALIPAANIGASTLLEEIDNMKEVKKAIFFDQYSTNIGEEDYVVIITQDYDDLQKHMLYEGSYPKTAYEVAIGGFGALKLGKEIGDTILVVYENEKVEFEITGFIQSGNNIGRQLALTEEGFRKLKPDYIPRIIYIYLNEGEKADILIELLESRYGNAIYKPLNFDEIIEGQMKSYITLIALMETVVLLITAVIVFLILYFIIKTMISRRRRRFGVQKALGYTTFQIMQQIALGFLPVSLSGTLIGAIMGCVFINPLITALFRITGIMNFNMTISYQLLLLLCLSLTFLSYIIAMMISYRIHKISAYVLVTE